MKPARRISCGGAAGPGYLRMYERYNGGRVLVFVVGAFAEMSEDVSRICDIIAHDLARTRVSYYNGSSHTTWRGPTSRTTTAMPSAPRA